MAHTFRNFWPQLVSWENLLAAYEQCRRHKRYKPEAAAFHFNWESNLVRLREELSAGTYRPGEYRNFYIHNPKRRKISAAPFRDRVTHHALVRILEPIYEPRFVFDSYACRLGKGTHRAVRRAESYLKRFPFYLKTDIVRFFPIVDHQVLVDLLEHRIADEQTLNLIRVLVDSGADVLRDEATSNYFSGDDRFAVCRPKGLPIGNLPSQFFANVFLDPLDHFIKEELRAPGYVRYADDLVLLVHSKPELWRWRDAIAHQCDTLRLGCGLQRRWRKDNSCRTTQ